MEISAVQATGLTLDYGKLRAVDHINFAVPSGEVFGFLGPNGAGKTTTIRMLTTLLEPTSGTAKLNGYDIVRQGYQARCQFGVVPEDSNVYRELTARANLLFSAQLYRVPKGERGPRASELLERFELADKDHVPADSFSRGMRRKLTIAMALMHRPSILFLDEPTAGLDVHGQRSILESIRQLSAEGITIFLTTHQMEEANQLCDRVAIIDHGKIMALGTPERLKQAFSRVQSLEVALDPSPDDVKAELVQLPTVENVIKLGDKWRVYAPEPAQLLPAVMGLAARRSLRVLSLNTLGPTLEDAFLLITGRRPTGDGEGPADSHACRGGHGGRGSCGGKQDGSCRMASGNG
jgi:ABC-2 type transport system ATP-binding protein